MHYSLKALHRDKRCASQLHHFEFIIVDQVVHRGATKAEKLSCNRNTNAKGLKIHRHPDVFDVIRCGLRRRRW